MASSAASASTSTAAAAVTGPLDSVSSRARNSIISNPVTETPSEDLDRRTSTHYSRPPSALSSRRSTYTQRRSFQPPSSRGNWGTPFTGIPSTSESRPQSSASRMSRTSRSHVPSITTQAFFRPMSSQRLQAQRNTARPNAMNQSIVDQDGQNEVIYPIHRDSVASNTAAGAHVQMGAAIAQTREDLPSSRGTDYTGPVNTTDRGTSNASPTTNTAGESRSLGDNAREHMSGQPPSLQRSPGVLSALHIPRRSASGLGSRIEHARLSSGASSPTFPKSPRGRKVASTSAGKNWEHFLGNTIFFFGGRIQNSRDKPINIATGIFVVIPAALFFAFSAPWLWLHISPAIPIVFAYVFFICISSFVHASITNPGIIPRNLHKIPPLDPHEDPLTLGPPLTEWTMVKLATSETAAMDVPTKYCKTCNIWRPPRCYHCRVCDNCVETQDHHCVWLNNCVGRRNYRYFFTFVSSATILCVYLLGATLAQCVVYQIQHHTSFGSSIDHNRVPFAMMIYAVFAGPYPASLWFYHLFLTGRGETTREYLNSHKFAKKDRHRPYTQGSLAKNWIAVFLRPRPPAYLRFTAKYEQGDLRFRAERRKDLARRVEEQNGAMEMHDVSLA